jgi:hypothetical protein
LDSSISHSHGQLGFFTPDGAACATPRKLENLQGRRVATAAAAKRHTAAVTVDGNVYTWGYGQATPRKVSLGGAAAAMAGATSTLPALNMHHTERMHATQVAAGFTCTTVITRCGAVRHPRVRSSVPCVRVCTYVVVV